MIYSDAQRLKMLKSIFDMNFKITKLYAAYLETCPDAITREIIDELCGDGEITREDAVAAVLCQMLGLDMGNSSEERRLIMDYIIPSIRILDAKKYTENPYYKRVAPKDGYTEKNWEFKWEKYPPYRAAICDDMIIKEDFKEIPPLGFFDEELLFPAVLEDGNEWMTLTPVDVDTCDQAIEDAHGRVITFGLGLGYYAFMVSEKDNVESITVVERSQDVAELFTTHILPHFSHPEKVKIIISDAYDYAENEMPKGGYDYAFVDIWRDASDGAPAYKRFKAMEKNCPGCQFSYWIENFLVSRIRAERFVELCDMLDANANDAPKCYDEFIERLLK